MASDRERTKAFNAARRAQLKRLPKIQADTIAEVQAQLRVAAQRVDELLRDLAPGMRRQQLESLKQKIAAALEQFQRSALQSSQAGADQAWSAGVDLVRAPLSAGGTTYVAHLNVRALVELKSAMTQLIQDVGTTTINRINGQLAQVIIGTVPAPDAITAIQKLLGGATRQRARTILYTELGRVYSTASQQELEDAAAQLPGLKKRWLRSGKRHPRVSHVLAHGQLRDAKEAFTVGGERLRYPRDPKGSAKNTINCGCISVPVTDGSTWGKATVRFDPQVPASTIHLER